MAAAPGRTSLRLRGGSRATEPRQTEPKVEGNIQNFFAFEGLIGAGKSTLLAKLEERGVAVIPEPLKAWQDSGIFAAFYGDMKRWSYTFQTSAFVTRVKAVEDALADKPTTRDFVGERSWFAGYRPAGSFTRSKKASLALPLQEGSAQLSKDSALFLAWDVHVCAPRRVTLVLSPPFCRRICL